MTIDPAFWPTVIAIVAAVVALLMGERGSDEWLRHKRERDRKRK